MELTEFDLDDCLAGVPRPIGLVRRGWHVKTSADGWRLVDCVESSRTESMIGFADEPGRIFVYSSLVLALTRTPGEQIVAVAHAQRSYGKMI